MQEHLLCIGNGDDTRCSTFAIILSRIHLSEILWESLPKVCLQRSLEVILKTVDNGNVFLFLGKRIVTGLLKLRGSGTKGGKRAAHQWLLCREDNNLVYNSVGSGE